MLVSQQNLARSAVTQAKPIRILHILGLLGHGGIEVWLMHIMRAIDRAKFQFDFLVHGREPGPFDEEVRELGGRIFALDDVKKNPFTYKRKFYRLLAQNGPYDVVHSHLHFFSGYFLPLAARCGVPMLIAHSHDDKRSPEKSESLFRRTVTNILRRRARKYATVGLACSSMAACSLFGEHWKDDPRWHVLLYGFDFSMFADLPDRKQLRHTLGLPEHGKIVGYVGRMVHQKNHEFAVRVLKELVLRKNDVHLLFVGSGELEQEIRAQLRDAGLSDHVTLAGDQHKVAPFYGAMDCMIFPSRHEGLGIVALEAQAAGLPVIVSENVPPEVAVIPEMVEHIPLSAGPGKWADAVSRLLTNPPLARDEALGRMNSSSFTVRRSLDSLCAIYEGSSIANLR